MLGLSLVVVPTIAFGGATLLGVVSGGSLGAPGPRNLSPVQQSFYRAGHAHAGVLLILSMLVQLALDAAHLDAGLVWAARIAAPAAAVLMSAGFFAVAHVRALRGLLYAGAGCLLFATLTTGVGLLRN
jgi:hypothetical protein